MRIDDVPSPINFQDLHDAEAWIEQTTRNRPWRTEFFSMYVKALNQRFDQPISVLELGSGPGFLAQQILGNCPIQSYAALDFSAVMHALACQRLQPFLHQVNLIQRNFRSQDWVEGLGPFDAIVTMQAVHEVRHKQRIPMLLAQLNRLLIVNGLFLFCDHYSEPDMPSKDLNLYLTRDELPIALFNANFTGIDCLLDKGGMALYAATRVL